MNITRDNYDYPEETIEVTKKGKTNTMKSENIEEITIPDSVEEESIIVFLKKALDEAYVKSEMDLNLMLRAKAEVENIRRRSQHDMEKVRKFCYENFAKDLVNVLDTLSSGLEASEREKVDIKTIREGMVLTNKLLLDTFKKFGIEPIDPISQQFDPAQHEALLVQENNSVESNQVLLVVQRGFKIYERILRPARVIVAKSNKQKKTSNKNEEKT